jgi:hypothetical protein
VGSRSEARARGQASVGVAAPRHGRPLSVTLAAAVEAVQSIAILIAAILAGIATAEGRSYQSASGIAITAIGLATAVVLGMVAVGLARARRWSRTPALLTQLFTGIVGIYLVQSQRYDWGVPGLVLSAAGFVLLLVPSSIRALTLDAQEPSGGTR